MAAVKAQFLLGIDIGTSSVKAVVVDATGRLISTASEEYPIESPRTGWAEQSPEEWWRAVTVAVRHAVQDPNRIRAVGFSGQMHGTVLLGEDDAALGPAIIWADQRTTGEVSEFARLVGPELLARAAGTAPAAGFMGPTLLWLKRHQPEYLNRARHVLLPKDYVRLRLTGKVATEASDASSTALFDIGRRRWSEEIIGILGLPGSLFPTVLEPSHIAGELQSKAANELGLQAGLPVTAGCADQVAQAVGNGLIDPGRGSVTIGSGGQIFIPLDAPAENGDLNVHVFCHAPENRWYILGAMLTAGLSLRWLRDLLGMRGRDDAFDSLSAAAGRIPPCSEGLLFMPYLAGERSPHMDPKARGGFVGLTMRHDRGHMARAVMEGVCFALRQVMDTVSSLGMPVNEMLAAGNGLESPVWRQILADVLGVPLVISAEKEQAGRGAAMIAGIGIGMFKGYHDLVERIPEKAGGIDPVESNRQRYEVHYRRFCGLYPLLKNLFQEL
jgi:xylulokinase